MFRQITANTETANNEGALYRRKNHISLILCPLQKSQISEGKSQNNEFRYVFME
jgi:hypothetical protein